MDLSVIVSDDEGWCDDDGLENNISRLGLNSYSPASPAGYRGKVENIICLGNGATIRLLTTRKARITIKKTPHSQLDGSNRIFSRVDGGQSQLRSPRDRATERPRFPIRLHSVNASVLPSRVDVRNTVESFLIHVKDAFFGTEDICGRHIIGKPCGCETSLGRNHINCPRCDLPITSDHNLLTCRNTPTSTFQNDLNEWLARESTVRRPRLRNRRRQRGRGKWRGGVQELGREGVAAFPFATDVGTPEPNGARVGGRRVEFGVQCGVCLEVSEEMASIDPCNHAYCLRCIRKCANCPSCRVPISGHRRVYI